MDTESNTYKAILGVLVSLVIITSMVNGSITIYQNFNTSSGTEPFVQLSIDGQDAYDANNYAFLTDSDSDTDPGNSTVLRITGKSDGSGWAIWKLGDEGDLDRGVYKVAMALEVDSRTRMDVMVGTVKEEGGSYYYQDASICVLNNELAAPPTGDYFDTDFGGCYIHVYDEDSTVYLIATFLEEGKYYWIDEVFLSPV